MNKHKEIHSLIRELTADGKILTKAIHDEGMKRDLPNDEIYTVVHKLLEDGLLFSPKEGYVEWL